MWPCENLSTFEEQSLSNPAPPCLKRRKPALAGDVEERLEQIIRQVADELGIKILELAINHVNLFISAYQTIHKIVGK